MLGIGSLISTAVNGVIGYLQNKQKIKAAVADRKAEQAREKSNHDSKWELDALNGNGWMDDALFICIVAVYVFSAVDPEGAKQMFLNWQVIPEWFQKVTMALVASVVGIKKFADYVPGAIKGVKDAWKG